MLAFSLNSISQNYIGTQGSSASGNIYHTGGNLGVGTTTPATLLDVKFHKVVDEFSRTLGLEKPSSSNNLEHDDNILKIQTDLAPNKVFSTQFQITAIVDDYVDPIYDIKRDAINIYYDTGEPNFSPINLNKDIDLFSLELSNFNLSKGQTYAFRVRIMNENLQLSSWLDELVFEVE